MHRDPITFGLEKVPGQEDARGDPNSAMERGPSFGPFRWKIELGPRIRLTDRFVHRVAVKTQLRDRKHSIRVYPGILAADRILHFASPGIGKMRHLIEAQVGVAGHVADSESGNEIEV